jgi:hypothetical protein
VIDNPVATGAMATFKVIVDFDINIILVGICDMIIRILISRMLSNTATWADSKKPMVQGRREVGCLWEVWVRRDWSIKV